MINCSCSSILVHEIRMVNAELRRGLLVCVKPPITQRVVEKGLCLLLYSTWYPHKMKNRNHFGKGYTLDIRILHNLDYELDSPPAMPFVADNSPTPNLEGTLRFNPKELYDKHRRGCHYSKRVFFYTRIAVSSVSGIELVAIIIRFLSP